jgi:hypothetical protein
MAPPFGGHDQRRPAQLMGGAGDGGIGSACSAMKQQMNQPTATAGQQLGGDPLMGASQITAAASRDHKGATRAHYGLE